MERNRHPQPQGLAAAPARNPSLRWLLCAVALVAGVCIVDLVALTVGAGLANARTVGEAGSLVLLLLGGYLLLGLAATSLFWSRGRAIGAGIRTVGTIAFLLGQGLLFAFMSLATLLATNR